MLQPVNVVNLPLRNKHLSRALVELVLSFFREAMTNISSAAPVEHILVSFGETITNKHRIILSHIWNL